MFELSQINEKKRYQVQLLEKAFPRPILFFRGPTSFQVLKNQAGDVYAVAPSSIVWDRFSERDWDEKLKMFVRGNLMLEIIGEENSKLLVEEYSDY